MFLASCYSNAVRVEYMLYYSEQDNINILPQG